jgi:DNA-binding transcriptional MerR regulator/effector-binding domain-containing protein
MGALLTIGEFSRVTHLSVKALRHYDDVGLLQPADVHASSGYRRYASAQVPIAHVIRRFRDLDMPLEQIRAVLEAPDVDARNRAIISHLERMQATLEHTQTTVESLKALLEGKEPSLPVEYRSVDASLAIAIRARIDWDDTESWLAGALDELHEILAPEPAVRAAADAALYSTEFFETHTGDVVAYIPIGHEPRVFGRVEILEIPAADLVVTTYRGPFSDIDKAYASLGTFVAERVLGTAGPIREHYLVTAVDTDDPARWTTEVCWPIDRSPGRS